MPISATAIMTKIDLSVEEQKTWGVALPTSNSRIYLVSLSAHTERDDATRPAAPCPSRPWRSGWRMCQSSNWTATGADGERGRRLSVGLLAAGRVHPLHQQSNVPRAACEPVLPTPARQAIPSRRRPLDQSPCLPQRTAYLLRHMPKSRGLRGRRASCPRCLRGPGQRRQPRCPHRREGADSVRQPGVPDARA